MEQERTRPSRTATWVYGPSQIDLENCVGQRLGDVVERARAILNVPGDAMVVDQTGQADLNREIEEGAVVEFIQAAGKKG
jgi:hypothetical protein